jgi:hypothetical protein
MNILQRRAPNLSTTYPFSPHLRLGVFLTNTLQSGSDMPRVALPEIPRRILAILCQQEQLLGAKEKAKGSRAFILGAQDESRL